MTTLAVRTTLGDRATTAALRSIGGPPDGCWRYAYGRSRVDRHHTRSPRSAGCQQRNWACRRVVGQAPSSSWTSDGYRPPAGRRSAAIDVGGPSPSAPRRRRSCRRPSRKLPGIGDRCTDDLAGVGRNRIHRIMERLDLAAISSSSSLSSPRCWCGYAESALSTHSGDTGCAPGVRRGCVDQRAGRRLQPRSAGTPAVRCDQDAGRRLRLNRLGRGAA